MLPGNLLFIEIAINLQQGIVAATSQPTGEQMSQSLTGKTAVVTGASSGIGKAIASALAALGASLHLIGRDLNALRDTYRPLLRNESVIRFYQADLSGISDVNRVVSELNSSIDGGVDVLVHAAACYEAGRLEDLSQEDVYGQYSVNVVAPLLITKSLIPALKNTQGDIVFINSSVIQRPASDVALYAVTKHALKGLADGLRAELNDYGIRVLSIYPGRTATRMQKRIHELEGKEYTPETMLQPEDIAAMVIGAIDLARTAEVTDIHLRPMKKH